MLDVVSMLLKFMTVIDILDLHLLELIILNNIIQEMCLVLVRTREYVLIGVTKNVTFKIFKYIKYRI